MKLALDEGRGLSNPQFVSFHIQIIPLQSQDFTQPQAGSKFQQEEFIVAVLLCLNQELLQVALGELIQRNFSDLRDDMLIDSILITELRVQPKLELAVVLIPKIHPVAEGYVRLAPGHGRGIFFFQFFQSNQALRLGLDKNIFCFGVAVVIVAGDNSGFPTAVRTLSDGSASIFSFLRHGLSSFHMISSRKFPTMPDAFFCISVVIWVYVSSVKDALVCPRIPDKVKQDFHELYELMNGMPMREMDQIVYSVCTLCRDRERDRFIHGVQVGIRLAEELNQ